MTKSYWANRSLNWQKMISPWAPTQEVVDIHKGIVDPTKRVLLLGVTPELANAYNIVVSVDKELGMIENVWPGDTQFKQAINADWLSINLPHAFFYGVLGDGSINMLSDSTQVSEMFIRILDWLKPGCPFSCRFFTRPSVPFTDEFIQSQLAHPNFSVFRRMLTLYLAEKNNPWVPVESILTLFNELFPDRSNMPWDQDTVSVVDAYAGSSAKIWFPTRSELVDLVPRLAKNIRFVESSTYELAEHCPVLTFTR